MINLSWNLLWSISFFWTLIYIVWIFSLVLLLLPFSKITSTANKFKNNSSYESISGFDMLNCFILSITSIFIIFLSWSSPTITAWFNHLIFSNFQHKIVVLVIMTFVSVNIVSYQSFYFSAKEIYDYNATSFNVFLWILILFWTNTLFSIIFVIEALSTLIFLLLITSTFSSTYYYNNLNNNLHSYFNESFPFFFLQTLLFFFWISLIASLNLFFALINFYINFFSFDWFLIEHFFSLIVSGFDIKKFFFFTTIWLNFLFCIFLKCGLAPFFYWKPTFFKGIPLNLFFFYITFFYFFILLFFIFLFIIYLTEIFFYFLFINLLILVFGLSLLLVLLLETFYLKTFLAISSILNTLFIMLAAASTNLSEFLIVFV